jgi:hypothetical protein
VGNSLQADKGVITMVGRESDEAEKNKLKSGFGMPCSCSSGDEFNDCKSVS